MMEQRGKQLMMSIALEISTFLRAYEIFYFILLFHPRSTASKNSELLQSERTRGSKMAEKASGLQ